MHIIFPGDGQPKVAVIREEGSNGDREMSVSLHMAGFQVTVQDLITPLFLLKQGLTLLRLYYPLRCGTSPCRT